jgi:hypothetical protein
MQLRQAFPSGRGIDLVALCAAKAEMLAQRIALICPRFARGQGGDLPALRARAGDSALPG